MVWYFTLPWFKISALHEVTVGKNIDLRVFENSTEGEKSRGSSVSIATGCGMDDHGSIPTGG
jgi:hypothetical protein